MSKVTLQPTLSTRIVRSVAARLRLFDEATKRQKKKNEGTLTSSSPREWTREDLYGSGRSR
jgi:hypothetical protein